MLLKEVEGFIQRQKHQQSTGAHGPYHHHYRACSLIEECRQQMNMNGPQSPKQNTINPFGTIQER